MRRSATAAIGASIYAAVLGLFLTTNAKALAEDTVPGASAQVAVPPAEPAQAQAPAREPAPPAANEPAPLSATPPAPLSATPPAPPAATEPLAASPAPAPPAASVQTVAPEAAEAILGRRVADTSGKDLGRLVDVLVDENGQPQAAVIDFGGFMGVGNRKVAVHWSALRFTPSDPKHRIELEMTPDQIKTAPEYLNSDRAAPVVTPADAAPAPK